MGEMFGSILLLNDFSNQYKFIESSDETSDEEYIFYHEIYVLGAKGARPQSFDNPV